MKNLTTRSSWMDFRDVLARRESFTTSGALKGVSQPYSVTLGKLPSMWHASALAADYVVYSYRTPIAWHVPNYGWVCPHERYSVTTSRHQSKINTAVSQLGEYSLSDCVNWETNTLGNCGGRVEMVNGIILCETCRNREL
jgi:hypothetical protein